jgi:hypothetical protein
VLRELEEAVSQIETEMLYIAGVSCYQASLAGTPIAADRLLWHHQIRVGDMVVETGMIWRQHDHQMIGRVLGFEEIHGDDAVVIACADGSTARWFNASFARIPVTVEEHRSWRRGEVRS